MALEKKMDAEDVHLEECEDEACTNAGWSVYMIVCRFTGR
jgi:hypothetical protein